MGAILDKAAQRGEISFEEAKSSKSRNALLAAVTGDPISRVDISRKPKTLKAGDYLVIASDGIETLDYAEILNCLETNNGVDSALDAMLESVENHNSSNQDNTSVLLLQFETDLSELNDVVTRPIMARLI